MVAPAHTCVSAEFNHCAFTGKVLRFPLVCPDRYRLRIYGNGSAAPTFGANQWHRIYSNSQLEKKLGPDLVEAATTKHCYNEAHRKAYNERVLAAIKARARFGDIIAHPLGSNTSELVAALPGMIHVETGIGYSAGPMGAYRIFESEHWRAWHMGRHGGVSGTWPDYPEFTTTFVAPNYYDPSDWPRGPYWASEGYALFVGRMTSDKGIEVINYLANRNPSLKFCVVSGEARSDRLNAPNINWLGRVSSRLEMAAIYSASMCTIVPSRFQEPFGGVAVESLMCGTPVIASDWGAFTETVLDRDGLRCNTPEEFNVALGIIEDFEQDRQARRERAVERFGVRSVKQIYTAHLRSIERLYAQGIKPANHP